MNIVDVYQCPNCGAALSFGNQVTIKCEHCKSEVAKQVVINLTYGTISDGSRFQTVQRSEINASNKYDTYEYKESRNDFKTIIKEFQFTGNSDVPIDVTIQIDKLVNKLLNKYSYFFDEGKLEDVKEIRKIDRLNFYARFVACLFELRGKYSESTFIEICNLLETTASLDAFEFVSYYFYSIPSTYDNYLLSAELINKIIRYALYAKASDQNKYDFIDFIFKHIDFSKSKINSLDSIADNLDRILKLETKSDSLKISLAQKYIHSLTKFSHAYDLISIIKIYEMNNIDHKSIFDLLSKSIYQIDFFRPEEFYVLLDFLGKNFTSENKLNLELLFTFVKLMKIEFLTIHKSLPPVLLTLIELTKKYSPVVEYEKNVKHLFSIIDDFSTNDQVLPLIVETKWSSTKFRDTLLEEFFNRYKNHKIEHLIQFINEYLSDSIYKFVRILVAKIELSSFEQTLRLFESIQQTNLKSSEKDRLFVYLLLNKAVIAMTSMYGYITLYSFISNDVIRFAQFFDLYVINRNDLYQQLNHLQILHQKKFIKDHELYLSIHVMQKFIYHSISNDRALAKIKELKSFAKEAQIDKYPATIKSAFGKEIKWLNGKPIRPSSETKDRLLEKIIQEKDNLISGKKDDQVIGTDSKKIRKIYSVFLPIFLINIFVGIIYYLFPKILFTGFLHFIPMLREQEVYGLLFLAIFIVIFSISLKDFRDKTALGTIILKYIFPVILVILFVTPLPITNHIGIFLVVGFLNYLVYKFAIKQTITRIRQKRMKRFTIVFHSLSVILLFLVMAIIGKWYLTEKHTISNGVEFVKALDSSFLEFELTNDIVLKEKVVIDTFDLNLEGNGYSISGELFIDVFNGSMNDVVLNLSMDASIVSTTYGENSYTPLFRNSIFTTVNGMITNSVINVDIIVTNNVKRHTDTYYNNHNYINAHVFGYFNGLLSNSQINYELNYDTTHDDIFRGQVSVFYYTTGKSQVIRNEINVTQNIRLSLNDKKSAFTVIRENAGLVSENIFNIDRTEQIYLTNQNHTDKYESYSFDILGDSFTNNIIHDTVKVSVYKNDNSLYTDKTIAVINKAYQGFEYNMIIRDENHGTIVLDMNDYWEAAYGVILINPSGIWHRNKIGLGGLYESHIAPLGTTNMTPIDEDLLHNQAWMNLNNFKQDVWDITGDQYPRLRNNPFN